MTSDNNHKKTADSGDGYDRTDINVRWVVSITIIVVSLIVISVFFLYEYFVYEKERQIYELTLKPESEQLLKIRASEDSTLTTYGPKDTITGAYRIPIDSAIQLMADENARDSASRGGN